MANSIFANSTTNIKTAKITSIVKGKDSDHYFAKVSCLSKQDSWQHINLLVSKNLNSFAKQIVENERELSSINPCSVEITDLHFSVVANQDDANKPYLNNSGILVAISRSVF